jgi:hypothetical protein
MLHLRIFVILPLLLAIPLPICHHDVFIHPAAYLLPKTKMMGCGLPLSRLYLLSQFNAVLAIDTSEGYGPFYAQTKNAVTISVCQPPDNGILTNIWRDDISVIKPTPWDVKTCNHAEINLYARLVSQDSFQPAFIRPLHLPGRCAFQVEFTPTVSGQYHLDVVNTWLAASTNPNPLSADAKPGYRWIGLVLHLYKDSFTKTETLILVYIRCMSNVLLV